MLEPGTLAVVFESGVISFDKDGRLLIHLSHTPDAPHPMLIQEAEAGVSIPATEQAGEIKGVSGNGHWRPRVQIGETEALPKGFTFTFTNWDWAQIEMSGDLTVFLQDVESMPSWFKAGHVHRFDGPEDGIKMWTGSPPPPGAKVSPPKAPKAPKAQPSSPPKPVQPQPEARSTEVTGNGSGCLTSALVLLVAGIAALS